jgi:hypothetical protein
MPDLPPNALILEALLTLMLPAFVLAALVLALVEWLGGAKQAPAAAAFGAILAFTFGPTLGHWLHDALGMGHDGGANAYEFWFGTTLSLMPGESPWNRLPWAALAALCVSRVTCNADSPAADAWLLRGAASFAIAWWVLPEHAHALGVWVAPAFAAAILLNWMILDCLARQPSDGSVPGCLFMSFFVASMVLLQAGIGRLSESAIVIGSACAGLAVIASIRRADTSGVAGGAAVMLPGLLLVGNRETSVEAVPMLAYMLAALAPLALAAALPFAHWHWAWRNLLRLTLIAIPLGFAIRYALEAGPPQFE